MKKIIYFAALACLLSACQSKTSKNQTVNLRFDWIPTMSFAGDIVAKNNFAAQNHLDLALHAAGEGIDPIKMVISGTDNIGIVGLDKLLMANEKGANLVAFAIIDNVTPTVFMSKTDKHILAPNDLLGKKVGIQSGGATEFVYRSLISKLKLDESKINEVQIGFDMKPFIEDQYDVRPGFIFDEAVYLDINHITYNIIDPRKYGLKYPGRVYFAQKDFIDKNPALIQEFVNTVAQGWTYALNKPDSAINQLKAFEPKIDYQREYKGLVKAKEYFSGYNNQILMPDTVAINDMVHSLQQLKVIKGNPKLSDYFNLSFINKLHEK
jgi:NitT/TauT family transport system substrate-binding protein